MSTIILIVITLGAFVVIIVVPVLSTGTRISIVVLAVIWMFFCNCNHDDLFVFYHGHVCFVFYDRYSRLSCRCLCSSTINLNLFNANCSCLWLLNSGYCSLFISPKYLLLSLYTHLFLYNCTWHTNPSLQISLLIDVQNPVTARCRFSGRFATSSPGFTGMPVDNFSQPGCSLGSKCCQFPCSNF